MSSLCVSHGPRKKNSSTLSTQPRNAKPDEGSQKNTFDSFAYIAKISKWGLMLSYLNLRSFSFFSPLKKKIILLLSHFSLACVRAYGRLMIMNIMRDDRDFNTAWSLSSANMYETMLGECRSWVLQVFFSESQDSTTPTQSQLIAHMQQ